MMDKQELTYKERANLFRLDVILDTLVNKLKEYAVLKKGFVIQPYNDENNFEPRIYSTKPLVFFDVPVNSLHVDETDIVIQRILSDPGYYVDRVLYYFREIRSIPECDGALCWIYMEISIRHVTISMTIVNTNIDSGSIV